MSIKKVWLLCLPALLSCSLINAQLRKGSLWLGGRINFATDKNYVKGENEPQINNTDVWLEPFFGKSISENAIAGVALYYRNQDDWNDTPLGRRVDENGYGAGIFFRKYRPLGKGFYIFLNGELNYGFTRINNARAQDVSDFSRSRVNAVNLFGYPGISYSLSRTVHLEIRTADLIRVSFLDEKKHIEFPVNNVRDEHSTKFSTSTEINRVFNYLGIGFRILINNKQTTEANK